MRRHGTAGRRWGYPTCWRYSPTKAAQAGAATSSESQAAQPGRVHVGAREQRRGEDLTEREGHHGEQREQPDAASPEGWDPELAEDERHRDHEQHTGDRALHGVAGPRPDDEVAGVIDHGQHQQGDHGADLVVAQQHERRRRAPAQPGGQDHAAGPFDGGCVGIVDAGIVRVGAGGPAVGEAEPDDEGQRHQDHQPATEGPSAHRGQHREARGPEAGEPAIRRGAIAPASIDDAHGREAGDHPEQDGQAEEAQRPDGDGHPDELGPRQAETDLWALGVVGDPETALALGQRRGRRGRGGLGLGRLGRFDLGPRRGWWRRGGGFRPRRRSGDLVAADGGAGRGDASRRRRVSSRSFGTGTGRIGNRPAGTGRGPDGGGCGCGSLLGRGGAGLLRAR